MSKISIIVPVYNVEKYLSRCLDSIIAQTFTDWECILVDDGSLDNSGKICDEYVAKDSRVKVFHKENGGVSSARNKGLYFAKGEYIAFIDSDDFVDPDYLELFWNNKTDYTISGFITYRENGEILSKRIHPEYESNDFQNADLSFLCNKMFSPYCALFKKEIIKKFNITFPVALTWGEDAVFISNYILHIKTIKVLPCAGYHYIIYDKSESLATRVRYDIIDMITVSRELYLNNLLSISKNKDEIAEIIYNDIRGNCFYFVKKLFYCRNMSVKERQRFLFHFMKNKYVIQSIQQKEKYHADPIIYKSLNHKNPILFYEILNKINKILSEINKIFLLLYHKVYLRLPLKIRSFFKKLRSNKHDS